MKRTTAGTTDHADLADFLRAGGVAAVPTDTVYGLVTAAGNGRGAARIYELKQRVPDKKLIILCGSREAVAARAELTGPAFALAERFWPGPLTLVLPDRHGGLTGFRVPAHSWLRPLLHEQDLAVWSTSANPAGWAAAVNALLVGEYFSDQDDIWLVDGGLAPGGTPSTVVACTGTELVVHRPGPLLDEVLQAARCGAVSGGG